MGTPKTQGCRKTMNEKSKIMQDTVDSDKQQSRLKKIPWVNYTFALLTGPVSCYFIVLLFTSGIGIITRDTWPINFIRWPIALFYGGILGGLIGGIILCWEIWMDYSDKKPITPPQLLSSDLLYLFVLFLLIYLLEFLSESISLQSLFFILYIAFFLVIGRNIGKYAIEKPETRKDILDVSSESKT